VSSGASLAADLPLQSTAQPAVPSGDVLPEAMGKQFWVVCGLTQNYPDPDRYAPPTYPKEGTILPAIHLNWECFGSLSTELRLFEYEKYNDKPGRS